MINFEYFPIEVNVVNATADYGDLITNAWTYSRPGQAMPDADELIGLDAQLMGLPTITLQMRIPILLRDILMSHRRHNAWVRSTRANRGLEEWQLYSGCPLNTERIGFYHEQMMSEIKRGTSQDIYRQWLPLAHMTNITVRFSFRSLVQVTNAIRRLRVQGTGIDGVLLDFEHKVSQAVDMYMPFREMSSSIAPINLLPSLSGVTSRSFVGAGIAAIYCTVPFMLRAQIIRHRQIIFADNLRYLIRIGDVMSQPQMAPCQMELVCSLDGWQNILSQRACWLVDAGLWAQVLRGLEHIGIPIQPPCHTGACNVLADHANRIAGTDPGLPCPRALNLHPDQRTAFISRGWSLSDYLGRARTQAEKFPVYIFADELSDIEANLDRFDAPAEEETQA